MKAIVARSYGAPLKVIRLEEVDRPVPAENEVLVKVAAASINKADQLPIRGNFIARLLGTGLLKPKKPILGTDAAGWVEAVGAGVTSLKVGDEVFGAARGSCAEYVCAPADMLVPKPSNASFEAAASLPIAAISALQGLRFGHIQAGQKVLIQGASGGVGTFAIQIACAMGTEVTAVCSPQNLENARLQGAAHVIDYTQEDFTRNGQVYDLILAVNGFHPIRDYERALSATGHYVVVGGSLRQIFEGPALGPRLSKKGGKQFGMMGVAKFNQADMLTLAEMLGSGKIKPLIEKTYPLGETAQAIQYLEDGHARGKIVISVGS